MTGGPNPLPFQDPEGENALLAGVVEAISAGLELGPLAARIAGLIVAATATDVCFVHVLDDSGTALTLTGVNPRPRRSTPPSARSACCSARASPAGSPATASR